jgi:hypothetical protein
MWLCVLVLLGGGVAAAIGSRSADAPAPLTSGGDAQIRLGVPEPIPDVDQLAGDADWDLALGSLTVGERVELQAIIDDCNLELGVIGRSIHQAVKSWAALRIAAGQFEFVQYGKDSRAEPGRIYVQSFDSSKLGRQVEIAPGECAELDLLCSEANDLTDLCWMRVNEFVESHTAANGEIR